jgi:hypothetical protein
MYVLAAGAHTSPHWVVYFGGYYQLIITNFTGFIIILSIHIKEWLSEVDVFERIIT